MTQHTDHAIVVGASMGGLLAARTSDDAHRTHLRPSHATVDHRLTLCL